MEWRTNRAARRTHRGPLDRRVLVRIDRVAEGGDGVPVGDEAARVHLHILDDGCGCRQKGGEGKGSCRYVWGTGLADRGSARDLHWGSFSNLPELKVCCWGKRMYMCKWHCCVLRLYYCAGDDRSPKRGQADVHTRR